MGHDNIDCSIQPRRNKTYGERQALRPFDMNRKFRPLMHKEAAEALLSAGNVQLMVQCITSKNCHADIWFPWRVSGVMALYMDGWIYAWNDEHTRRVKIVLSFVITQNIYFPANVVKWMWLIMNHADMNWVYWTQWQVTCTLCVSVESCQAIDLKPLVCRYHTKSLYSKWSVSDIN